MNPNDRRNWYLIAGFLLGLLLRIASLWAIGTGDMIQYQNWGQSALKLGLAHSYFGIYFPLQWQFFEICSWAASSLHLNYIPVFKFWNLIFDTGIFFGLLHLLRRNSLNPVYVLLYWLHPWFLSMFSVGYVDFQFGFFILLSVLFLRTDTLKDFVIAGLPLGIAFIMKPQTAAVVITAFLFALAHFRLSRSINPFGILFFPIVLFVAYQFYFMAALFPTLHYRGFFFLIFTYLHVPNVMPCLTAHMLNLWYPVAYFLKRPGDPIYSVSDKIQLLPHITARLVGATAALLVIISSVWRIAKMQTLSLQSTILRIFCITALAVPFLATSAHDNHTFLGMVLLIPFFAIERSLMFRLAAHLLLLIQFLNTHGRYGTEPAVIIPFLRSLISPELSVVYSVISVAAFLIVILKLWMVENERPILARQTS